MTDLETLLQQVGSTFAGATATTANASTFAFANSSVSTIPTGDGEAPDFGTFKGTAGADRINGTAGTDFVDAGAGNDVIITGAGSDVIKSGAGKDVITGGAETDIFVFDAKPSKSNMDRITDFRAREDFLVLDTTFFTKVGSPGFLKKAAFTLGKTAADASDRVVYDKATGSLYYDKDGTGAAAQVKFAQLKAGTTLTHTSIITMVEYPFTL